MTFLRKHTGHLTLVLSPWITDISAILKFLPEDDLAVGKRCNTLLTEIALIAGDSDLMI